MTPRYERSRNGAKMIIIKKEFDEYKRAVTREPQRMVVDNFLFVWLFTAHTWNFCELFAREH